MKLSLDAFRLWYLTFPQHYMPIIRASNTTFPAQIELEPHSMVPEVQFSCSLVHILICKFSIIWILQLSLLEFATMMIWQAVEGILPF